MERNHACFFQKLDSGAVSAAVAARIGDLDGFLVVSPDQRVAQFSPTVPRMRELLPLGSLLFWKSILMFGEHLPLAREARVACAACGSFFPTGIYGPSRLCLSCRDPRSLESCAKCRADRRPELLLDGTCLACWTVSGLLHRFGESTSATRGTFERDFTSEQVQRPAPRSRRVLVIRSSGDDDLADED